MQAREQVRSGQSFIFDEKITFEPKAEQVQGSGVLLFFDCAALVTTERCT